jgi:hypothetical protein
VTGQSRVDAQEEREREIAECVWFDKDGLADLVATRDANADLLTWPKNRETAVLWRRANVEWMGWLAGWMDWMEEIQGQLSAESLAPAIF